MKRLKKKKSGSHRVCDKSALIQEICFHLFQVAVRFLKCFATLLALCLNLLQFYFKSMGGGSSKISLFHMSLSNYLWIVLYE